MLRCHTFTCENVTIRPREISTLTEFEFSISRIVGHKYKNKQRKQKRKKRKIVIII